MEGMLRARPRVRETGRSAGGVTAPPEPFGGRRLLERFDDALRARHYSPRTAESYRAWVKRFIYFHGMRHPGELHEPEINAFLTHLAVGEHVSASTQNQALSALLFLYRHVIGRDVGELAGVSGRATAGDCRWC